MKHYRQITSYALPRKSTKGLKFIPLRSALPIKVAFIRQKDQPYRVVPRTSLSRVEGAVLLYHGRGKRATPYLAWTGLEKRHLPRNNGIRYRHSQRIEPFFIPQGSRKIKIVCTRLRPSSRRGVSFSYRDGRAGQVKKHKPVFARKRPCLPAILFGKNYLFTIRKSSRLFWDHAFSSWPMARGLSSP